MRVLKVSVVNHRNFQCTLFLLFVSRCFRENILDSLLLLKELTIQNLVFFLYCSSFPFWDEIYDLGWRGITRLTALTTFSLNLLSQNHLSEPSLFFFFYCWLLFHHFKKYVYVLYMYINHIMVNPEFWKNAVITWLIIWFLFPKCRQSKLSDRLNYRLCSIGSKCPKFNQQTSKYNKAAAEF